MGSKHHDRGEHRSGHDRRHDRKHDRKHDGEPAEDVYERYRSARRAYEVAKYEYKSAKYAVKAARLRGQSERAKGTMGPVETRDSEDRRKVKGRQVVLEVVATERLGEHFQRITLGGPGFADFRDNEFTDQYVKILFVDPALGLEPPYDVQELRKALPRHQRPVRRTYTVHSVDREAGTLVVDVVLHGDTGVAGPWAARAEVGEKVAFSGPGGKYAPDPAADAHLLVGDESSLPAIAASLARLAEQAPAAVGRAFIEVGGPEDEWELTAPAGIEVIWLHRGGAYDPERTGLAAAVEAIGWESWPAGRVHAFVHGEKSMARRLRRHLIEERGVDRRMLSLSSYWTFGRADD